MTNNILTNRTVFLISPEDWGFIFVSKHHYAIELAARGNRVYFINPPGKKMPGNISIKPADEVENLYIVDYSTKLRGLRFLPSFVMRWANRRFLRAVEKKAGVGFDVVWNFENSRFFDLRFAGKNVLKIYFQVDEDQNFHPAKAAQTADIALAINSEIFEIIRPHNSQSFLIPHSFQGFLSEAAGKALAGEYVYKKPADLLKVFYVGNLEHKHIDVDLFEKVVNENSDIRFHLVGPYDPDKSLYQRLKKYTNVNFKGKVPSKEIPSLLDSADALMLVYDSGFTQSSHKLLEYLASGKAIVSTYMSEYDKEDSLLYISRSSEDYLQTFRRVLSDIEICNNPEHMQRRIQFAMDHTYSAQLDKLEKLIDNISPKKNP